MKEVIYLVLDQMNTNLNNHIDPKNNLFTPTFDDYKFNDSFAERFTRKIQKYTIINFQNKEYFVIFNGKIKYMKKGVTVKVLKQYNGELFIMYQEKIPISSCNQRSYN